MEIHIVLLSGGSGKRLWPLSSEKRPKQFLRLLPDGRGGTESMLRRIFRQMRSEFPTEHLLVATSASQVDLVRDEVGLAVDVVAEPAGRDTFGAIALAGTWLRDRCGAASDAVVAVVPVDAYADERYARTVRTMCEAVDAGIAKLLLMGIAPSHPSPRFGYIVPGESLEGCAKVARFIEKPPENEAKRLLEEGALWNGGVFAFRLGYLLDIVERRLGFRGYDRLAGGYRDLDAVSFDIAVTEQERSVASVPYDGAWKDLGTWDALVREIGGKGTGTHIPLGCDRTVVINGLPLPVVTLGTDNLIIAAGDEGILVTTPEASGRLKEALDLGGADSFAMRDTGTARTRRIELESGRTLTISQDSAPLVVLVCEEGEGELNSDGATFQLAPGASVAIGRPARITIAARQRLRVLHIACESFP
jgi:mannose-1-phosphate guanylyltransferase